MAMEQRITSRNQEGSFIPANDSPSLNLSTQTEKHPLLAFAVAIGAVLVAALIRWLLNPSLGPNLPFATFYLAVVFAAWYGGLLPGLLAAVLGCVAAMYLFVSPVGPFHRGSAPAIIGMGLFLAASGACAWLSELLHRAQRRARSTEQHIREVLESTSDDFVAVDADWRIAYINAHAARSMGLPDDRLIGQNIWDRLPGLLGSDIETVYRQVMEKRVPARSQSRSPLTGRWLDYTVYPTNDGIAAYFRDHSHLKQTEENARFMAEASRLLAQSLDYDITINQVADLVVPRLADWCFVDILEPEGLFRKIAVRHADQAKSLIRESLLNNYVPDLARAHPISQAYRSRRPELVQRITDEWLSSRARDAAHLELLRAMEMRSAMFIPLIVHDQVLGVLSLVAAESGQIYSQVDLENAQALAVHIGLAIANARLYREARAEVHDRRQAESALRESEERYRTLVTATGDMVWRAGPDGRSLTAPTGWEEFTGQTPEEFRVNSRAMMHPSDIARVSEGWAGSLVSGNPVDVEFRLRTRDGVYRRMHSVGVPVRNTQGEIIEWIGTTTDINDRREAEEQLQRSQRMETIGRLAGGIAHETNNQMTVILGFSDFLLRGTNLTEEQRSDIEQVGTAAIRVADLTRQLLAFSRQQVLDTKVVDLDVVVAEAESVLKRTLGPEIRLSVALEPGTKWVRADRTQLVQVLVNLALNARDAMPGSGELTISTRRADQAPNEGHFGSRWPARTSLALLSVADTGTGMDAATMNRIFEPFFSTKSSGHGTGLGLSVVEGIVSQSGGDLWVESKLGYGTVFTVGLPLTSEPARPAVESQAGNAAQGGTEIILLVDDEDAVRRMLARGLRMGGYEVYEATNAQEAIAILQEEGAAIQLVVTDVAMPDMSGVELGNRAAVSWPRLPIIFVSGHPYEVVAPDPSLVAQGRFIQKPFTIERLLDKIRHTLDESVPRSLGGLSRSAPTPHTFDW
jgi:PAS domain S-box-containing protein